MFKRRLRSLVNGIADKFFSGACAKQACATVAPAVYLARNVAVGAFSHGGLPWLYLFKDGCAILWKKYAFCRILRALRA